MIFVGIIIGIFIGVGIMCIFQINRVNKYIYKYELIKDFDSSEPPKAYVVLKDSDKND